MSRVIVTCGAGFIGSAIIKHLQNENHDIYVIDNLSFGRRELVDIEDSKFFIGDVTDRLNTLEIIDTVKPDWLIHLAAIHFIPYCNSHPIECANTNIYGAMNVLEAAEKIGVSKFFFASTTAEC
jgi:UDP-glucose 4-epimerase